MKDRSGMMQGEAIVPLPPVATTATHIRSTMIAASVATLRSRGLFDAYRANLPASRRDDLPGTVAGFWLPMADALTHYQACDALHLPAADVLAIGEAAGSRSSKSALSIVARLAVESGATPWTILAQSRRLWERAFQGSAVGVYKLGPKETRFEIVAWPLARIEYNRVSFRGILRALMLPFCTQAYVHELAEVTTGTSVAYRLAWA